MPATQLLNFGEYSGGLAKRAGAYIERREQLPQQEQQSFRGRGRKLAGVATKVAMYEASGDLPPLVHSSYYDADTGISFDGEVI